ncbi:MAG: GTP-binding protein [Geitlerinemataceae cyanobacterium]
MNPTTIIAVAGPPGSGKTTWIRQFLASKNLTAFYCCPGMGEESVDLARIGYCYPSVQVFPEEKTPEVLSNLPDRALVFLELGFHIDVTAPPLSTLPCRRVAVLPPGLENSPQSSEWHEWADEVVAGSEVAPPKSEEMPEVWRTVLSGRVFDAPSLDEISIELTGDAYGKVQRMKGIFELPDGKAFYVDFAAGLSGIEYTELPISRWLNGRPDRFSGIEVTGWNLDKKTIADTLLGSCLPDSAIASYQEQYKAMLANELEEIAQS